MACLVGKDFLIKAFKADKNKANAKMHGRHERFIGKFFARKV